MNPNPFMFVYARHGKTHKVFEFTVVIAMSLAQSLLALHRSTIEKRKTPRGKQTYNILKERHYQMYYIHTILSYIKRRA